MKVNITMLKWMVFVFAHLKLRLIYSTELSNFISFFLLSIIPEKSGSTL